MTPTQIKKDILIGIGVLFVATLISSSFTVVMPGNTGVVFNRVTGSLRTSPQGMVLRFPFVTKVQSYPTSLRTYTMVQRSEEGSSPKDDSLDLPTFESQHIRQDISVTYNTSGDHAADVYKSFRGQDIEDIEASFIRRTIITIAQNAAGQMHLTEVTSTKRDELQKHIEDRLRPELEKMGFNLDKVNLGAGHLPEAIEKQLQAKMGKQQEAAQAEFELLKQQTLAKAAIAHAEGEAQANKLLQQSVSAQIIQYKALEKWNGVLPQVSGGAVPFVNLESIKRASDKE